MNTPTVKFNVINQSFSIASILKGISGVAGITERGPFCKTDLLITTWAQFLKIYGGYIPNSDFPLLCKRAFDKGAQLRVSRVGHYTDITDITTIDAVKANLVNYKYVYSIDAALVTGNILDIAINGFSIPSTTFATSSDATLAAFAAEIANYPSVESATVNTISGPSNNDREIIIWAKPGQTLSFSIFSITGGASQANISIDTIPFGGVKTSSLLTPTLLFNIRPKYEGLNYNNLYVVISNASNGNANYFNMVIKHTTDNSISESYTNLTIPASPTIAQSHYLDTPIAQSEFVDFTYFDLSAAAAPLRPKNTIYYFAGGTNGTAPVAVDYIGDSAAGNGLHAFDKVDDMMQVTIPEISDTTVHIGGSAYSEGRQDLMYFAHLSNNLLTQAALVAEREAIGTDSYYTAFFAGGLIITDPVSGIAKNISEMGDILGIMNYNDSFGEWFSPAGLNRGKINNVLGVVNNYGTTAKYNDLNILANRQINMVIRSGGATYLNGNYSAVLSNSKLSFMSAVRFLIYLQKSLSPTLKRYLQEPADIPSFKALYREVEPFMDSLVTGRAIYSYVWDGDQDVDKIENVVVNNPTDLDNGLYKVKLYLKIIPSMQEISVDLIVTATSVSFENLQ